MKPQENLYTEQVLFGDVDCVLVTKVYDNTLCLQEKTSCNYYVLFRFIMYCAFLYPS